MRINFFFGRAIFLSDGLDGSPAQVFALHFVCARESLLTSDLHNEALSLPELVFGVSPAQ